MNGENNKNSPLGDEFDRVIRALTGLPDVIKTKPSTVRALTPILNLSQTFIVQTYRQRDPAGDGGPSRDTIFIEYIGAEGSLRIALPPIVADTIARQREALIDKNRKRAAKQATSTRQAKS